VISFILNENIRDSYETVLSVQLAGDMGIKDALAELLVQRILPVRDTPSDMFFYRIPAKRRDTV
jgi:hypothetical protein